MIEYPRDNYAERVKERFNEVPVVPESGSPFTNGYSAWILRDESDLDAVIDYKSMERTVALEALPEKYPCILYRNTTTNSALYLCTQESFRKYLDENDRKMLLYLANSSKL